MRLRGAAVIHGPKLDDDILAKALLRVRRLPRGQGRHPLARHHFCPLIILLFASLARSPLPVGRTEGRT